MVTPYTFVHQGGFRVGDSYSPVHDEGILTDSLYNRDIRHERVDAYVKWMRAGTWITLLTDPFSITTDGQVVNGQHRIAAVSRVEWPVKPIKNGDGSDDPEFTVVWGVDPLEALYADQTRRTEHDEAVIGAKLVQRM